MRENNAYANKTWVYTYDLSGNITARKEYSYTIGTLPESYTQKIYSYSTGTWGDQLTAYDGTTISYDAIGNPTNWRNALGLMWSGKQLTYIAIDGLDEGLGASYNADGIRTKKTYWDENANQTVHDYVLDGSKIVKETVTGSLSYTMYYYYDESGVAGFEYNGTVYYYLKNIQGDVINILNSSGQVVATYSYDAWGKVLSVTGTLASTVGQINPFRYRGYYYDTETGYYYLQTRYYDPVVGRFLNADGIVGANGGVLGYNMFAYCNNNPVMGYDPSGEAWWHWVIGAVVVAVCAVAVVATAGGAAAGVAAVAAVANGTAAATTASTVAAGAFIGSAATYGCAVLEAASTSNSVQEFNDKGNWGTVADTIIDGAIGGYLGYRVDKSIRRVAQEMDDTFLPDEYYSNNKAPKYATPNSQSTTIRYNAYTGEYEKSTAYYDYAGRQATRIDYTDHGRPITHSNPHVHFFEYNELFPEGREIGR